MHKFKTGRFFAALYEDHDFDYEVRGYYPVVVLEFAVPRPFLNLDYAHLEWLAAVWGFKWHKPFAPYFDEAPF